MGGFFVFLILLSLAFMGLGVTGIWPYQPFGQLIEVCISAAALLLTAILVTITKLYRKTSANAAFVRTGMGGSKVILDGGTLVIPVVHKLVDVSLETMKLEVERKGPDALITKDNLRVDVKAEFYIKVQANVEDILNAARSLGEKSVAAEQVGKLVFEKLVSALRSVAATKELIELHAKRDEFASAVQEIVRKDLRENGLSLESVTISRLDQTDQTLLRDDNIFDAQGKKKITEITQSALVERNKIEREAEQAITTKNVATTQQILGLQKERVEAEATQGLEVAKIRAEAEREKQEFQIEQDKILILRAQEKEKTQIGKDQAVASAEIAKEQAVATAERDREIVIAMKDTERQKAEQKALEAGVEREKAGQMVLTVQVTAEAEREAAKKLIAAKQVIEQERIKDQTAADVLAYTHVKDAEGKRKAADMEAEAKLRIADSEARAREMLATGETALKMVDVNVAKEQVNVEQKKVDVQRQALENKQTFSEAALHFELQKMEIETTRDVKIALANAIGQFMSKGTYTVFGDPETLSRMMNEYAKGLGIGTELNGLGKNLPAEIKKFVETAAEALVRTKPAETSAPRTAPAEPKATTPHPVTPAPPPKDTGKKPPQA
jgi:flotillin